MKIYVFFNSSLRNYRKPFKLIKLYIDVLYIEKYKSENGLIN